MRKIAGFMAATALAASAGAAWAIPVTYTVSGANLTGGGSISGTFTYDADINTYSAINLVTTAGGAYPGATYITTNGAGAFSTATSLNVVTASGNGAGEPVLNLVWGAALTNAGGTISISTLSGEGVCAGPCINYGGAPAPRFLVAPGSITSTAPVPTLSEWAMILMGLALAGMAVVFVRRRQLTA